MKKERIREIKFNIQPKHKVVVGKGLRDTYINAFEEVEAKCSKTTIDILTPMFMSNDKCFNIDIVCGKDFIGVARCDDEDEFNEQIGKIIAANKADMKYHNAMSRKYELIIKLLDRVYEEINRLRLFHLQKVENIKESLKRYYCEKD